MQKGQIEVQKGQLDVAKAQLEQLLHEGPRLRVTAKLQLYRDKKFETVDDGKTITSDMARGANVVAVVKVRNQSPKYSAVIGAIGAWYKEGWYTSARTINCPRSDGVIDACDLPATIYPQREATYYIDLNKDANVRLKNKLTCNQYYLNNPGHRGVRFVLDEIATGLHSAWTEQRVFYMTDCPS